MWALTAATDFRSSGSLVIASAIDHFASGSHMSAATIFTCSRPLVSSTLRSSLMYAVSYNLSFQMPT